MKIYKIPPDILDAGTKEGERRAAEALANRRQPRMDVRGGNRTDGMREEHVIGAIGEICFARLMLGDGARLVTFEQEEPDDGFDVSFRGVNYQVCTRGTTDLAYVDLLVPERKIVKADQLVLCRLWSDDEIELVGFIPYARWKQVRDFCDARDPNNPFPVDTWFTSWRELIKPDDYLATIYATT